MHPVLVSRDSNQMQYQSGLLYQDTLTRVFSNWCHCLAQLTCQQVWLYRFMFPTVRTSSCTYSYDLGLIGGAMLGISQTFNITSNATKQAIVGAAKLGAFFGTFLGGVLMLRYGRRLAIAAEAVFFVLGPVIMATAVGPG